MNSKGASRATHPHPKRENRQRRRTQNTKQKEKEREQRKKTEQAKQKKTRRQEKEDKDDKGKQKREGRRQKGRVGVAPRVTWLRNCVMKSVCASPKSLRQVNTNRWLQWKHDNTQSKTTNLLHLRSANISSANMCASMPLHILDIYKNKGIDIGRHVWCCGQKIVHARLWPVRPTMRLIF